MITTSAFDAGSDSTSRRADDSAVPRSEPGSPTSPVLVLSRSAATASPSFVSGAMTSARASNSISATRPGAASMRRRTIAFAASNREPDTSSAPMLFETSMAMIRFVSRSVTGTRVYPARGPAYAMNAAARIVGTRPSATVVGN